MKRLYINLHVAALIVSVEDVKHGTLELPDVNSNNQRLSSQILVSIFMLNDDYSKPTILIITMIHFHLFSLLNKG